MGLHRRAVRLGVWVGLLFAVLALTAEDHGARDRQVVPVTTLTSIGQLPSGSLGSVPVDVRWSAGVLGAGVYAVEDAEGRGRVVLARRALPRSGSKTILVSRESWLVSTPWGRAGRFLDQVDLRVGSPR